MNAHEWARFDLIKRVAILFGNDNRDVEFRKTVDLGQARTTTLKA
jgi:hypothetical protein